MVIKERKDKGEGYCKHKSQWVGLINNTELWIEAVVMRNCRMNYVLSLLTADSLLVLHVRHQSSLPSVLEG